MSNTHYCSAYGSTNDIDKLWRKFWKVGNTYDNNLASWLSFAQFQNREDVSSLTSDTTWSYSDCRLSCTSCSSPPFGFVITNTQQVGLLMTPAFARSYKENKSKDKRKYVRDARDHNSGPVCFIDFQMDFGMYLLFMLKKSQKTKKLWNPLFGLWIWMKEKLEMR